jgi:hypothetical protein
VPDRRSPVEARAVARPVSRLAALTGLHPARLLGIMRSWLSASEIAPVTTDVVGDSVALECAPGAGQFEVSDLTG